MDSNQLVQFLPLSLCCPFPLVPKVPSPKSHRHLGGTSASNSFWGPLSVASQGEEGDSCGRWTRVNRSGADCSPQAWPLPGLTSSSTALQGSVTGGGRSRRGASGRMGWREGLSGGCDRPGTCLPACRPPPAPCTPTGSLLIGEARREITTNLSSSSSAQDALTPLISGSSVPEPVTCRQQAGPGCAPSCLDFLFYFPGKGRAGGGRQPVIGLGEVVACQRRCKLGLGPGGEAAISIRVF